MAQLLAYVRYEWENEIKEDFLFCKELRTTTTANNIFETLDNFMRSNEINWKDCIGVCTDGAAAMTGRQSGVVQRIKEVAPLAVSTHCFLHREALATKEMEPSLHGVLDVAVKIVNFVKARATNSRLFTVLCEEVGADYHTLLMHTDVRWLSRGQVLMRLFSLREELRDFLADKRPDLAEFLDDDKWLAQLSYLSDIFGEMNKLNRAMQVANINTVVQHERVEAFKRKLHMWKTRVSSGISDMFEHTHAFIADRHLNFKIIQRQITVHISKVLEKFDSYFPALTEEQAADFLWIRNPFTENIEAKLPATLPSRLLEELIEISSDASLKAHFSEVPLESFWSEIAEEHPVCYVAAMKVLIPFSTTYLCEAGFSTMTALKTKYRARLTLEDDMRLALSKISPRIDQIITRCQQQSSH